MNIHKLVKVLAAAGIAASVVTSTHAVSGNNESNIVEAAETVNTHYEYQGDTGFGDGSFLINDAFVKTLEEDGNLAFNGYDIEASKEDYEKNSADNIAETTKKRDQSFTLYGDTATKVTFPIQNEELPIDEVIDVYGKDYEVKPSKNDEYETYIYHVENQKEDTEKNIIAFKVEDDYVTQGIIGYSTSY